MNWNASFWQVTNKYPKCIMVHDKDINAAENMLAEGLKQTA